MHHKHFVNGISVAQKWSIDGRECVGTRVLFVFSHQRDGQAFIASKNLNSFSGGLAGNQKRNFGHIIIRKVLKKTGVKLSVFFAAFNFC